MYVVLVIFGDDEVIGIVGMDIKISDDMVG